MQKITEEESRYHDLELMTATEILQSMNAEDKTVASAVEICIPVISILVDVIVDKMLSGGRLFYIGAGTSGRLGIVDASECPPTFGVQQGLVVGIIAGGDGAIRKAVEHAEDDPAQGWKDLQSNNISHKDVVIGIAASGTTPYVVGALKNCREQNIITACITCNIDAPVAAQADHKIEIPVGPEFVTGSTRLKSGTAQKLCLNMISTAVMIRLGRVKGNRMVDMMLTNDKLIDRGTNMVMEKLQISYEDAQKLLLKEGSVRKAIEHARH
ncbi:MAG: N-acetylmuramic acid 6-phosphate etherase [Chitinophagales bacterium]